MKPACIRLFKKLPSILSSNKQCQICPEQQGPALIWIGKFCNDGCIAVADSEKCIAYKDKPVIKASRCSTTGMRVMDLNNPLQTQTMLYANLQQFTSIERIKFLHSTLGFLALSALIRTIHTGYLNSLPDLTPHNISKLGPSDIVILGHLDTKRKNV